MEVELKEKYSNQNPDEAAVVAARGDHMDRDIVGEEGVDAALSVDDAETRDEVIRSRIERLLRRGHFGPFEHAQAFFAVRGVSRDIMAQITRHRHMSFDVQSMRYVDFSDASFAVPDEATDKNLQPEGWDVDIPASVLYMDAYDEAVRVYEDLLEAGMDKEDARKVLPIGTEVHLTFSANLRSLMHFFDLRVSGAAQSDTVAFATKVMEEARDWAPVTVDEYEEHVRNQSLNSP